MGKITGYPLSDDQFLSNFLDPNLKKERKKEYNRENRKAKASLAIQKIQVITEKLELELEKTKKTKNSNLNIGVADFKTTT